jgi:hypothetical protein
VSATDIVVIVVAAVIGIPFLWASIEWGRTHGGRRRR